MPESAQKFLIIRLSSIGDIVHALPAVSALGDTFPAAEIHWVVETRHAGLLEGNRYIHRVIQLDTLGWRGSLTSRSTLAAIWRSIATLRETGYDAAIDFQGLYKSALIAWLSRARERVGFAEARLREPVAGVFYTTRLAAREATHVVELNLALVEHLGVPRIARTRWQFPLPSCPEDEEYIRAQLRAHSVGDFIIINPGGGWQSKCWAPENFAGLIRQLASQLSCEFVLTGSPAEEPLIVRILQDADVPQARYIPSTITQFIALARQARLFVGGDTGPLHLAAAVGTPIVAIYGPTDPARNGPFSPHDITLWNRGPIDYTRRAVKAGYIPGIPVESVVAGVRERLARANG
jgi:heptosyltransferase-1